MRKRLILLGIILIPVAIGILMFIIKVLWGWVVLDIFPGAVAQGLIVKEITWGTSFKILVIIAFIAGIARTGIAK